MRPRLKLWIVLPFVLSLISESQSGSQVRRNSSHRDEYNAKWQINDCGWSKPAGHAKRVLLPRPSVRFVKRLRDSRSAFDEVVEAPMTGVSEQISLQLQSYAREMLVGNGFETVELFPDLDPEDLRLTDELATRARQMTNDSPPLKGLVFDKRADAVLLIKADGEEFPKSAFLASDSLEVLAAITDPRTSEYFGTCLLTVHTNVASQPKILENAMSALSKVWFRERDKLRLTP